MSTMIALQLLGRRTANFRLLGHFEDGSGVYATDGTTGELISYTMPPKGV